MTWWSYFIIGVNLLVLNISSTSIPKKLPLAVLSVPPINRDAVAQQLINRRGKVVENYDEDTLVRLQFVACYVILYISICVDDVIEISFCLIREKKSIYIIWLLRPSLVKPIVCTHAYLISKIHHLLFNEFLRISFCLIIFFPNWLF